VYGNASSGGVNGNNGGDKPISPYPEDTNKRRYIPHSREPQDQPQTQKRNNPQQVYKTSPLRTIPPNSLKNITKINNTISNIIDSQSDQTTPINPVIPVPKPVQPIDPIPKPVQPIEPIPVPVTPVIQVNPVDPIPITIPEVTVILKGLQAVDQILRIKEKKTTLVPNQKQIQAMVNKELASVRASRLIINKLGTLL